MQQSIQDLLLFTGSSNPELAGEIADVLHIKLGQVKLENFPDKEISLQVLENVGGRDVFVFQTTALDPNNYLMELLILIDTLKRASTKSIGVVMPYFGYGRQDRKDKPRVPITAKLVANLLSVAGADRILTMDLHTEQLQGFFDIPVDNLHARPALADAFRKDVGSDNLVVVTPDIGSIKLARAYAAHLKADFAIVDKQRKSATQVEAITLIGDVKGKDVLLADDMCTTAGTITSAAKVCQEKGAKRIFAAVTHGIFVGDAIDKIEQSPIQTLYASNTVQKTGRTANTEKIKTVSVSQLFGQAVSCIVTRNSISSLFPIESGQMPTIGH
jgi:ribose-phosphate pyrophosphokinase